MLVAFNYDWFKVELVRKKKNLWFSAEYEAVSDRLCEWNIQYYSPSTNEKLVSISGTATAWESKTLESIKPGVLDSLDALLMK